MNAQLDTNDLKQLAEDLRRIGLETVAKTMRRAAEEIERLRATPIQLRPMPDRPGSKIPAMGTENRAIINGIHFTLIKCEHFRGMVRMVVYRPLPTQSWANLTHPVNVAVNLKGLINTRSSLLLANGQECLEFPRLTITTVEENLALGRILIIGEASTVIIGNNS